MYLERVGFDRGQAGIEVGAAQHGDEAKGDESEEGGNGTNAQMTTHTHP